MKTLVVYDSVHGNTEKIARAIGDAISGEVKVLRVNEVNPSELKTLDLLIVGSPTQGGSPTQAVRNFLNTIQGDTLKGIKISAFDTRFSNKLVGIFGYAAGKIATSLKKNGGTLAVPPQGFIVKSSKGPLGEGELEHAASWAKELIKNSTL